MSDATEFSAALRRLLESTGVKFSAWAERLGVSKGAVSQWASGATVPQPERLRLLVGQLRDCPPASEDEAVARQAFDNILRRRAHEVAPGVRRLHPSIGHYLLEGLRESFQNTLATLPPRAAEELLKACIGAGSEIRALDESVFAREENCAGLVNVEVRPTKEVGAARRDLFASLPTYESIPAQPPSFDFERDFEREQERCCA